MSASSSSVYRSKAKSKKTEPSDIICACGGQTELKYFGSKENPDRRYLCSRRMWVSQWADVDDEGAEKRCQICQEVTPALLQGIKDKDDLAKCKDKLVRDDAMRVEDVDNAGKQPGEGDSNVFFEDQDFE
ncbi:hypothetical protein Hanom_Chr04g00351231 [Helianthus anomalus]